MVEYFPGQSSFTKAQLIASDRAKIVVKVSSHIPRIINWVTKKDHPRLDYLMRTIFKEVDNSITFRNIEPTTMKIKILQLPPPTVQSISPDPQIECSDHNKAIESDDDFQHPPFITRIKGKEKVIERLSPVRKKTICPSKINIVEKHSDVGTSHTNKIVEQKSVQDITEMGHSKKSSDITISCDEFEAFKKSGSSPICDLKNFGGFILTKSRTLAAANPTFVFAEIGTRRLFWLATSEPISEWRSETLHSKLFDLGLEELRLRSWC
ncbi:hypothetical protein KY289_030750 [Solanum tuberosum]|nr:hypothetical protein KY289_030750 [Solanum tuberosum]